MFRGGQSSFYPPSPSARRFLAYTVGWGDPEIKTLSPVVRFQFQSLSDMTDRMTVLVYGQERGECLRHFDHFCLLFWHEKYCTRELVCRVWWCVDCGFWSRADPGQGQASPLLSCLTLSNYP